MPASPPQAALKCWRADQLLVAHRGVERLARLALAVPAGNLLVDELAVRRVALVGEALVLGPDARVDDADDDVLARADAVLTRAAELLPEPARRVSPRNVGVDDVSAVTVSSGDTASTPACFSSAAFCAAVSFAAKPLYV